MTEIQVETGQKIYTLATKDILQLHEVLCNNYQLLPNMEPVSPSGVKNMDLLESAVSRQWVGSGSYYKYPDPFSNCATLVFGLVKNHSFHNGNKRIGFLSMIKHLYINGYVIRPGIAHDEIYDLLKELADNNLIKHARSYHSKFINPKSNFLKSPTWTNETDMGYVGYWLRTNSEHKSKKIKLKTISINELLQILNCKKLEASYKKKTLRIAEKQTLLEDIFGRSPKIREYTVRNPNNIALNIVENIRKDFKLSQLDGVDNNTFYNDEYILNNEIVSYKRIIYKLAKT